MIFKLLILVLIVLMIVYYAQVIAHILEVSNITNQRINLIKCIIPFYFWLTD